MSLIIENLTAGYGARKVIANMTLPEIPSGSLVAVIGPNAVGKSTLLKAIAGLVSCTGKVDFNQQDLTTLDHHQRVQHVGYLPQTLPQATSLVAYELVYSACRAVSKSTNAEQLELSIERVFGLLGIESLAFRKMAEMSGGQRQMVGLAQVLVRRPKLLLLDEPTSALDLHWQLNVLQAIRAEVSNEETIALVASHDLNLSLRFCDQLIILGPKGLLGVGPPQDVLTPDTLRAAYGIEGRVEQCSKGYPVVLVDSACEVTL